MPTILQIFLSDHFPGTNDFSYTDFQHFNVVFFTSPYQIPGLQ